MAGPSREQFAVLFARLEPAGRRAFVEDLWNARGWETTREGGLVVAVQDGAVRRIAVDSPLPEADLVVSKHLESNLETDADVVDPAEIHDQLLYAIERSECERLFLEHFGTDFYAAAERSDRITDDGKIDLQGDEAEPVALLSTSRISSRLPAVQTVVLVGILLVCGVVGIVLATGTLAGPLGEGGDDETDDLPAVSLDDPAEFEFEDVGPPFHGGSVVQEGDTSVLTSAEEGGPAGTHGITHYPPSGIFHDGVHDVERIGEEHAAALEGADDLTYHVVVEGPPEAIPGDTPADGALLVRTDGEAYHLQQRGSIGDDWTPAGIERYADDESEYVLRKNGDDPHYERRSIPEEPNVTARSGAIGADLVETYLDDRNANVTADIAADVPGYQVTATAPPARIANETEAYRATAFVTQTGVVLELEVDYYHEPTGAEVRIESQYGDFGETTVNEPHWYENARNATI